MLIVVSSPNSMAYFFRIRARSVAAKLNEQFVCVSGLDFSSFAVGWHFVLLGPSCGLWLSSRCVKKVAIEQDVSFRETTFLLV